tara:strand:- start:3727 stop:4773 length:1047 start_codon:yes stop_codon:yes gene_type:complete
MLENEKTKAVDILISGVLFFRCNGKIYKVHSPTSEMRALANFLSSEASEELSFSQLLTKQQLAELYNQKRIWTYEDEEKLEASQSNIEELQINVYKNFFNTKAKEAAKRRLSGIRKVISQTLIKKNMLFNSSLESYYDFIKDRFLAAISLYDINNNRIYKPDNIFKENSFMLDKAHDAWLSQYEIMSDVRALALKGPWRHHWDTCKGIDIFGVPKSDLNIFQKNIVLFSKMYDNARESMDAPPEEIFIDNDAFDGWMSSQRKEAEKRKSQKNADAITNQKGDEIFMVTSGEDKDKVFDLNSYNEKMSIKNKLSEVRSAGGEEIREGDLSDVKMKLRKELVEMVTGNRK